MKKWVELKGSTWAGWAPSPISSTNRMEGGDSVAIVLMMARARAVALEDLIDTEEFAEIVGVQTATIHAYRKKPERYGVPDPVAYIGSVPVWVRHQAYDWINHRPGQGARSDLVAS